MMPLTVTLELTRSETAAPFDFRFSEQEYLLRQEDGYLSARLPWDSQFQEDLAELARPSPNRGAVQRLGDTLGAFLEKLGWAEHEKSLWEATQAGHEVHVTFRFAAAELYSLPWELVALRGSGQHLGELPGCHLHYEWPGAPVPAAGEAPPAQGGRILFAWSVAGGNVPMDDHLRALREVCARNEYAFDPARDVIDQVSLRTLDEALSETEGPVAALHILCHGARSPDPGASEYGLQWNASQGGGTAFVDAGDLRGVLARHAGKVKMVVLCACQSGNAVPDNHLGSVAQALHRVGIPAVVASRMPLSLRGSTQLTETLYEELIGQLSPLCQALGAVRGRLKEDAERLDWASLQLYARAGDEAALRPFVFRPYRGLLAFQPNDRRFFFGRSKLEKELLERVQQAARGQRSRFQVVAGASGAGKSSLVMAGLVPLLPKQEWDWLVVRPGELVRDGPAPTEGRSAALRELQSRVHSRWSSEPLPVSGGAFAQDLVEEVRQMRQACPARKLLLVLDQSEEVFTLLNSEERQAMIRGAWALARQPELGCVIVATLRVDHFERCGEVVLEDGRRLDTIVYAEEHRIFVAQMGMEELAEAIEQPARKVGLELETGLVDRLCRDVGREPGALPLLEHALDLLWQRRDGRRLTHGDYEEMEGVAGALTQTAEQLYEELSECERAQARRLLVRLVAVRDLASPRAQGRVWVEEVRPQEGEGRSAFEVALEKLVGSRLLVTNRGGEGGEGERGAWVQLAHETLLRRWKRLERWVGEDWEREQQLRELEDWAEQWEEHQRGVDGGASYLLTGDRLVFARGLREKHGGELSPRSCRLLKESQAAENRHHEQEQARQEKERETMRVLAAARARAARFFRGLFVVTAVLFAVAAIKVVNITKEHQEEQTQRKLARNADLLRLAEQYRHQDPTKAVLFLREVSSDARDWKWIQAAVDVLQKPVASAVLKSHGGEVVSAAFSPDGQRVVTASKDGAIRVWSTDGRRVTTLVDSGHSVSAAGFSLHGERVLAILEDGTARVWSTDGELLFTPEGWVEMAAFSPDGQRVVTTSKSRDGTAWVWGADGKRLATLKGQGSGLIAFAFSPDGQRVVTVSKDGVIGMWRADGKLLLTRKAPTSRVNDVVFSPDGRRFVTAPQEGPAQVWSADGALLSTLEGHTGPIWTAAFSPDGQRVVTVSQDKTARIWSVGGELLSTLEGHTGSVWTVAFSQDGQRVVTASQDRTARVWSVDGKLLSKLEGHGGGVNSAAFSPDGQRVVTWSTDGTARVWDLGREQLVTRKEDGEVFPINQNDGVPVISGTSEGAPVKVLNHDQELLATLNDHGGVSSASLSPDGQRLLTASGDGIPRLWSTEGHLLARLAPYSGGPVPLAFSPDSRKVAAAADDGKVRVWSAEGELLGKWSHDTEVASVSFSDDGRRVMTASGGVARVWNLTGRLLADLGRHDKWLNMAVFSQDGHRAVTVDDKIVRVLNMKGDLLSTIKVHDLVDAVALSPDNKLLVTVSRDEAVCVWSVGEERLLAKLEGHGAFGTSVAFSPDGEHVVMRPYFGEELVWPLNVGLLRQRLEDITSDCLGIDERRTHLGETAEEAQVGLERCKRERDQRS